jgi:hypothetical protein
MTTSSSRLRRTKRTVNVLPSISSTRDHPEVSMHDNERQHARRYLRSALRGAELCVPCGAEAGRQNQRMCAIAPPRRTSHSAGGFELRKPLLAHRFKSEPHRHSDRHGRWITVHNVRHQAEPLVQVNQSQDVWNARSELRGRRPMHDGEAVNVTVTSRGGNVELLALTMRADGARIELGLLAIATALKGKPAVAASIPEGLRLG